LLTIPNEQLEASDEPVVMFSERPAGAPQAIKAWFYPGERIGQEFVYPKRQAMELAAANHAPVIAFSDESADTSDAAKMHSAQVGRVDGSNANGATTASNTADRAVTSATNDSQPATTTAQSATTSAPAASTADQRSSSTPAAASNSAAPSTAASTTASANPSAAQPTGQSANRTGGSAVGTAGTTASTGTTASNRQSATTAVGTSGQAGNASTTQQNANQSSRPATGTAGARTLPRTASPLPLVGLLSGLMLAGGFGARQARKRSGETR